MWDPFGECELSPHLTQCGQGWGLPASQVSSWSIQPFGHNTPTLQTDRTDRQTGQTDRTDRQRSDSIGRTVLQTVAQNRIQISVPLVRWRSVKPSQWATLTMKVRWGGMSELWEFDRKEYWINFITGLNGVHAFCCNSAEVSWFGWNFGHCEYIVYRWPWLILGAIRAEARVRERGELVFLSGK